MPGPNGRDVSLSVGDVMSTSLLIVGMYSRVLRRLLTGQATTTLLADTHRSPLKQGIGLHEVMNKLLEPDLIRTL